MTPDYAAIAETFRDSLPRTAETTLFRIDALDRLGIPVMQANSLSPDRPTIVGHGYGLAEAEAATGALGELCEEVHVGAWVVRQEPVVASYDSLVARLGARGVADPLTLCLPAGSDYRPDQPRAWLPARRYPSDEAVLVPLEWLAIASYQLGGREPLITPITNGLGAGLDLDHALAHGLMELLQRDGNVLTYRAFDEGRVIRFDEALPDDTVALLDLLRGAGIDVTIKLAATDFGIANLYVVGDDPDPSQPIQITACGEAAHPDRLRGLRKAVLEFIGSRSRKVATHGPVETLRRVLPEASFKRQMAVAEAGGEEARALDTMADWIGQDTRELRRRLADNVFVRRSEVAFSSLPNAPAVSMDSSAARLAWLADKLAASGHEILWVDCSPPGSPVRAVKVVVPGLESETMSYHRIGWRGVARLRAREDALISDRPATGFAPVRMRAEDAARAGGEAFLDVGAIDRRVEAVYPLYREANPFSAQLARARLKKS